jgi:hypothetical protein
MDGFLKQIAANLFQRYGSKISDLTIVFPNRRAGLFFTDYLNSLVNEPLWLPEIISINEFFTNLSELHVPDKLSLIFRLYKVYRDLTGTKESFDEFYFWGEMLVDDFDQVDKYLVDAPSLFSNISDLKEIEERFSAFRPEEKDQLENFWKSLSDTDKTTNQLEFIRLWKDLKGVYQLFKSQLKEEGLAFEGMLFRDVYEKLKSEKQDYIHEREFVVAGFNALNRCEEELFQYLQDLGKAQFFWDFDQYYVEDPVQEAGLFMRENLRKFPQKIFPYQTDLLLKSDKQMKIVSIPSQSGQAQVAAQELINRGNDKLNFDDTALVLCDEELLLPVLSAVPSQIESINVTMGFPVRLTPLFSLISLLMELQKNCRETENGSAFYNKNVIALLNHQMFSVIDPEICKKITEYIVKKNVIYLSCEEFAENIFLKKVFIKQTKVSDFPDYFLSILKDIYLFWGNNSLIENSVTYREYIYQTSLAINGLKTILFEEGAKIIGQKDFITKETFFRFINQHLGKLNIPFEGEPLSGLQVMGILETRTLDFKNVIILSMNDGIMPKSLSSAGSFIPYNLRKGFGLPAIEEQNAMYAYYFYRLLQRADNVTFIYNSGTEGLFTGEKSRFLYQLQVESGFKFEEKGVGFNIGSFQNKPITIGKDEKVLALMKPFLQGERKLSPSAMDKYLTCPLSFYFRYVAGLSEPEEVTEEIDARLFGLLFHKTMEALYKPLLGKSVEKENLESILNNNKLIDQTLTESFREEYFRGLKHADKLEFSGRNWLVFEVVRKYIIGTITLDISRVPFILEGLETKVHTEVDFNGGKSVVIIGGIIDRTDRKNGGIEILDYKTGITELSFPMIADLFDKEKKNRNKAAFQTLVYSYILHKNKPEETIIKPGIYSLRKIFEEDYDPILKCKEDGNKPINFPDKKVQFDGFLEHLLGDIFNKDIPFTQTVLSENCQYCAYNNICKR